MPLIIGKRLQAELERKRRVRFWGRNYLISPCYVPTILGDGMKLLAVQPLNTRPRYYLIRIDSSWDESNYESPCVGDNMDDIYEAIEGYVGPKCWTDNRGKERREGWPSLDDECGSSWWDETKSLPKRTLTISRVAQEKNHG